MAYHDIVIDLGWIKSSTGFFAVGKEDDDFPLPEFP
jgi:hypothetical protein